MTKELYFVDTLVSVKYNKTCKALIKTLKALLLVCINWIDLMLLTRIHQCFIAALLGSI